MFRTPTWLGRWKGWDHIRGMRKTGGSIHIRHTHGSKGRYDRLSSKYGLRDGRRHASNHMRGGLGVKIGGGLFGLRIPRQHALGHISASELELELHGHPNITNPYRELLDEHPNIEGVVKNPAMRATFILQLPTARSMHQSSTAIPKTWKEAKPLLIEVAKKLELDQSIGALHQQIVLVLCTEELSVSLLLDQVGDATGSEPHAIITSAMNLLCEETRKGARIGSSHRPADEWITIEGKRMRVNVGAGSVRHAMNERPNDANGICVEHIGWIGWLARLSGTEQVALRLRTTLLEAPRGDAMHKAETADALIRWFVYNNDPRAHFSDAAPHDNRTFPVHTFVECGCGESVPPAVRVKTNRLLQGAGYRYLRESPSQLIDRLRCWTAGARIPKSETAVPTLTSPV